MALEQIMVGWKSQTQKTTWCMITFTRNVQKKTNLWKQKITVAQGWAEREMERMGIDY